jgi:hypothetical protein
MKLGGLSVLVQLDATARRYVIALNNSTNASELRSDFSFLEQAPRGVLEFDFGHMAAPTTGELRDEFLPGGFGYQPTRHLVEIVACIADYAEEAAFGHKIEARLPNEKAYVGKFLRDMGLPRILKEMCVPVRHADRARDIGRDDQSRRNLIPLRAIRVRAGIPDFQSLNRIREGIRSALSKAVGEDAHLAEQMTSIVIEAVDNAIEYGQGGIIGGLFYPRAGEVEITLVNRTGGFGGDNPATELNALVAACEGRSSRPTGGGNGIAELSRLAFRCYGTLMFRNGNAAIRMLPDGSVVGSTDETGLPNPGASVTILLQLLPAASGSESMALKAFRDALTTSLQGIGKEEGIHTGSTNE